MLTRKNSMLPDRAIQIGFAALLILCMAQVAYWITDEAFYTMNVRDGYLELHAGDARAASLMKEQGMDLAVILESFPQLEFDASANGFGPSTATLDRLEDQRHSRLNRYGWEGTFFLLVLIAAIAILVRTLRQDSQLRRRQQNFLAAVSHEFKSPLASIQLAGETLAMRDLPVDKTKRTVQRILTDTSRLQAMVSNLLNTTRLEQGLVKIAPQSLELTRALQSSLDAMRTIAEDARIGLACEIEPDLVIIADEPSFQAVMRNLIDNAVKATKIHTDGSGEVRVDARRADQDHGGAWVQIDVSDNGGGFSSDDAETLFEMFYRPGDELRRATSGTGLGLFIVRRFVQLNGGRIEAFSDGPGHGARFRLHWPGRVSTKSA